MEVITDCNAHACLFVTIFAESGAGKIGELNPMSEAISAFTITPTGADPTAIVAVGTANYAEALETMEAKGRRVVQGGIYNGVTFAYMSTDEDLRVITEIFDWPPGLTQEPDARYP